jgi:glyoxylase-like metal-dependent hydrolase (beta-lactamase superfamily II)
MTECITALEYTGGVTAVDSGLVRPQMACCYMAETSEAVALIEVGSNASADRILKVLGQRGRTPAEVSHVIVTHVHLDHAGGAGTLMAALPRATLVVHPRGARHMIDPSRLESSARAVYGDTTFDAMYGSLQPVPENRVLVMEDGDSLSFGGRKLEFIDTPGHARHHFCIWDENTRGWFTGDTFGLMYQELRSGSGAYVFPTTTPVQFDPPALLASIDRLMARHPDYLYPTHFGRVTVRPGLADQLKAAVTRTVEIAERHRNDENRTSAIENAMETWLIEDLREHGVTMSDEELSTYLSVDIKLNTQGVEFWLDHS